MMGQSQCLHPRKQDNWKVECTDLEEEYQGQLYTNVGTVKDDVHKEDNTTRVSFF